jgi:hypothetical protein
MQLEARLPTSVIFSHFFDLAKVATFENFGY